MAMNLLNSTIYNVSKDTNNDTVNTGIGENETLYAPIEFAPGFTETVSYHPYRYSLYLWNIVKWCKFTRKIFINGGGSAQTSL